MIPRRRALAALIAAVCSACPSAAPSAAGRDAQAQDLLREMNRVRAEHGLPALRADARLMLAAQRHAEDMAAGNRLDHRGSDGSGLRERAQRAGYAFSRISENLAAGQASAGAVVRTWLDSPPHRRNLLDPDLRHAGAGYVFRPAEAGTRRYGHYWAANFGRPAE